MMPQQFDLVTTVNDKLGSGSIFKEHFDCTPLNLLRNMGVIHNFRFKKLVNFMLAEV